MYRLLKTGIEAYMEGERFRIIEGKVGGNISRILK